MEALNNGYIIAGLAFFLVFTVYMAVDAMFAQKRSVNRLGVATRGGGDMEVEGGDDHLIGLDTEKSGLAQFLDHLLRARILPLVGREPE